MSTSATLKPVTASASLLAWPALLALLLAAFCFTPRLQENPILQRSFLGATAALLLFAAVLFFRVLAANRGLTFQFAPKPVHYVQFCMHASIYAYWGWYWREVYHYVPLILAQIVFAYALDMLVCWSRRDNWILGFGPIPIILSTNLFLWFRDDFFYLQFVMISIGVVAKEYVRWRRDGRLTHIFNPSAVGLFIFSVILIATHSTSITWGSEIAETLHRPPNIYLEIFVLGLIVQALFSVTLVTLAAGASLFALNLLYTRITGVYQFVDSTIPVSVFIGIHLLVTDPATSPRSKSGKVIFGTLYGCCVFGLYSFLALIEAPRFYDKLLCVPPLNLSVRFLDRIGDRLDAAISTAFRKLRAPQFIWAAKPLHANLAFMSIWIVLFIYMMASQYVVTSVIAGSTHPGSNPDFWRKACTENRYRACVNWVGVLNVQCLNGSAQACYTMGSVANLGLQIPRDPTAAGRGLGRACDLHYPGACPAFVDFVRTGGDRSLAGACNRGDPVSCFYLGTVYHLGGGVPQDNAHALVVFQDSCSRGFLRACGVLGDMYTAGQGTAPNPSLALVNLEKACTGGWAESCAASALIYHRGTAGVPDEIRAQQRFSQACTLGFQPACPYVDQSPLFAPTH